LACVYDVYNILSKFKKKLFSDHFPKIQLKRNAVEFTKITPAHIADLASIIPKDRLSTGASVLDLHAKDQSHHPPSRPEAVIWPVERLEVAEVLRYANEKRIPVVGWGSGSSLEGNPIPVQKGIVLDFSMMNRILDIKAEDFQADALFIRISMRSSNIPASFFRRIPVPGPPLGVWWPTIQAERERSTTDRPKTMSCG
jgi:hypothetical protein